MNMRGDGPTTKGDLEVIFSLGSHISRVIIGLTHIGLALQCAVALKRTRVVGIKTCTSVGDVDGTINVIDPDNIYTSLLLQVKHRTGTARIEGVIAGVVEVTDLTAVVKCHLVFHLSRFNSNYICVTREVLLTLLESKFETTTH